MGRTRRTVLLLPLPCMLLLAGTQNSQEPRTPFPSLPNPDTPERNRKLPNGKSQDDAIAKEQHERVLKDADDLVAAAEQLRDELKKAGDYVVPLTSVKKTEDIEKLARRIRGHLKY